MAPGPGGAMDERTSEDVIIVGGGLVGSLLSVFLNRRGLRVAVYEQLPDLRKSSGSAGRSINLVVTSRGIDALERVGLRDGVMPLTVPVMGRMMHSVDGDLSYQPYGKDDTECNYSISRAELNRHLITEAEHRGVRFHFRRKLVGADLEGPTLRFQDETGADCPELRPRVAIGADGAASALRAELVRGGKVGESVELLGHGYKELTIPAAADGSYRIEKNALHIWPRGDIMLMALPNSDGSFTVTLYLPETGPSGFESLNTADKVGELFREQFPDSIELIPDLERSYLASPTGVLGTVRCEPWHVGDRILLIGDAAHAIVPFFGQGMNCGFEDCTILDALLDEHGEDGLEAPFSAFSRSRKPDADAIAEMALENFVEMRDRVGDARFLLLKEVEHLLEQEMPRVYRSRYSMVMYSSIPYSIARDAGVIQQEILGELCAGLDRAADLDLARAERLIREKLTPFLSRRSVELSY